MTDPWQRHLDQLRQHRAAPPERDLSLGFLRKQFKHQIEKPHKQLGDLAELWQQLVPQQLLAHTRIESFNRGVLRIAVDSSARLYELDRLLRQRLQTQLIEQHQGAALRKVQLRVIAASADNTPKP
jgi:predicted nucleic acid-binding Zn ribbon protein